MSRALVFGAGVSGRAAAALLARRGVEAVVLDGAAEYPVAPAEGFALAVASPGVPPSHPWQLRARADGVKVVSELQLGCEALRERGVGMLAVTGSKGKSSVVKMVADALTLSGRRAVPCGNYGRPVCDVALEDDPPAWAVVEVSSFQLECTELSADAFAAAALLNLQDDHLDRHGTRERYHELKRRLLGFTRRPFDFSAAGPAEVAAGAQLRAGSYFDNPVLAANGAAAAALLRAAGLSDDEIARGFATFKPLPHRFQTVATVGGTRYVDDSKATSLAALAAGVLMVGPPGNGLRLIAGGLSKGDSPLSVKTMLAKRVKKVYLIGSSAPEFLSAWGEAVPCEVCGTLREAVKAVKREAGFGETVLLSPGTASFDQFKSYAERGDVFAALVKEGTTE